MAHCQHSLEISRKSVRKFLSKVANKQTDRQTDRQTDKQTNNDDYITPLAGVMNSHSKRYRPDGGETNASADGNFGRFL